jgi:hypothetical protein
MDGISYAAMYVQEICVVALLDIAGTGLLAVFIICNTASGV